MIVLFTDFGLGGPYTGQMKAVLHHHAPGVAVVDLFADAPAENPQAAAYLLAAYAAGFPAETVFLAVVDPGVGGTREALAIEADERWFVGPDNGLFEIVRRRALVAQAWTVEWRPPVLSASFHGRDLFAPVAARLALGEAPPGRLRDNHEGRLPTWPDDLSEVVYLDHYGNAMTGLRASILPETAVLVTAGRRIRRGRTFGDVAPGEVLWYENSNGLAEIAVNQGRADALGLGIGSLVQVAC